MKFLAAVFLSCISVLTCQQSNSVQKWSLETNNSITENLKVNCKARIVPGLSIPDTADTFLVSITYPSNSELSSFQTLPTTLTKANAKLLSNAVYHGYDKWAVETGSQWQVPTDHVSQNRSNCYKLTTLAANEGVLDLYQNFKSVHKTFYLLRNRHTVVHPSGSVMVGCGYYQGVVC